MAQLTDDCFAFSGPLLPVDEMEGLIAARVAPVTEVEEVALAAALGRVAAGDVIAGVNLPPFDNSAVDGFAVRHGDLASTDQEDLAFRVAGHGPDYSEGRACRDVGVCATSSDRGRAGAP